MLTCDNCDETNLCKKCIRRNQVNDGRKRYYWRNKEKLISYQTVYGKLKYKCDCGSVVSKKGKQRHFSTKKHIKFLSKK